MSTKKIQVRQQYEDVKTLGKEKKSALTGYADMDDRFH